MYLRFGNVLSNNWMLNVAYGICFQWNGPDPLQEFILLPVSAHDFNQFWLRGRTAPVEIN